MYYLASAIKLGINFYLSEVSRNYINKNNNNYNYYNYYFNNYYYCKLL